MYARLVYSIIHFTCELAVMKPTVWHSRTVGLINSAPTSDVLCIPIELRLHFAIGIALIHTFEFQVISGVHTTNVASYTNYNLDVIYTAITPLDPFWSILEITSLSTAFLIPINFTVSSLQVIAEFDC